MSSILLLASIYCFCLVSTKHALHILQQNRYNLRRYVYWCKKRVASSKFSPALILWFIPCMGIAVMNQKHIIMSLMTLLMLVYGYVLYQADRSRTQILPLIVTARIKRLFGMMSLVEIIWLYLLFRLLDIRVFIGLACLQFVTPWFLIVPAQWLMMPIEQGIRKWYVSDAKQLMRKYPHQIRIGITGSYGKTSVKNILYYVLSEQYYCYKTPKSYNNLMGITRSIREQLKPVHQAFICEMGADHVHEISRLAQFVEPRIGIVSAVGPQHLQTFHTIENILQEKMQLIEQLPSDGLGVINMDNDYIRNYTIKNTCRIIRYGIHQQGADLRAYEIQSNAKGTTFQVDVDGHTYGFHTILLGEHNVLNILASLAVGWHLNVPWEAMQKAVERVPFIEHRLELNHQYPFTMIDNSYNSNPVSARLALDVLAKMPGRHILITPGFIDLGSVENEENRRLGEILPQFADEVILVGEQQTRYIYKGLLQTNMDMSSVHVVKMTKDALALCTKIASSEDTVLIENDLPDAFNH